MAIESTLAYPETRREPVREVLHGRELIDPYRWLEESDSPESVAWMEAQNRLTRTALDGYPARPAIHKRLEELLSIGSLSTPSPRKNRIFYFRRHGTQNHSVLFLRDDDGPERTVIDPNTWSADGTSSLDWYYSSKDGRLIAYGRSEGGDEKSTLYLLEVDTGRLLEDQIPDTRAASLAWEPDHSGFFYSRYPPGESYGRRIYYHRLGQPWQDDPLIYGQDRAPEDWPSVSLSPDGRWLVVSISVGWTRTDVYLYDRNNERWTTLVEGVEAIFGASVVDGVLHVNTNFEAPRYRLMTAPVESPEREHWRELIPEAEGVLEWVGRTGPQLIALYATNAVSQLKRFSLKGEPLGELELPAIGSVTGVGREWDGHEVYYGFSSFTFPPRIYRYDLDTGTTTLWGLVEADISPEDYLVEQEWYESRDGTRVPMFLVYRRDLVRDGQNPTLLNGYGGFNVAMSPDFYRTNFLWLEAGGVFAMANLRGGSEFGETWHQAGMLANKQNVFDDFVAAAEHLIARGFTHPTRLAISGGSNGGLLVGAALTQRPDLFQAVVCSVPLLDMLRYHHFRLARLWIPEYGSADDPEQFEWLHAYSPYHRVQDKVEYPAVLLTTGVEDSRVDPLHARKMAARLQQASSSSRPVLLRVEMRAGHGAGKPLSKILEESTDKFTFLFWQLGVSEGGLLGDRQGKG